METWDDASRWALVEIFTQVRRKPRSDIVQMRSDLDGFIDDLFHAPAGFEKAKSLWSIIGGDALELAIQRGFPQTIDNVHETLIRKQRDYGHENIRRFGRQGLMVRMHDKVARLENLFASSDGGLKPNNESIEDNIMDVVGYAAIGIMWESRLFLLPLAK